MKYRKILYIGIIDDGLGSIVGGFATANKRNVDEYGRRQFEVSCIAYPILKNKNLLGFISYLFNWCRFFFKLLKISSSTPKNTIVHFTPLYKYFIYIEYFIIKILTNNKFRILLDIRAGSFINYVENGSSLYFSTLKAVINKADLITVEGEIYLSYIEKKFDYKNAIFYYPNYVLDKEIVTKKTINDLNTIRILYFGRINYEKGIETIQEVHQLLLDKDINVETTVIGSFENEELEKQLLANNNLLNFKFLPPMNKKKINKIMKESVFFIFPTKHKGEGHSNALTEAMAYGLIPIVTDNGFNRQIVKDSGLILNKEATPDEYVDEILKILNIQDINRLSKSAIDNIKSRFSQEQVVNNFFQKLNEKWEI